MPAGVDTKCQNGGATKLCVYYDFENHAVLSDCSILDSSTLRLGIAQMKASGGTPHFHPSSSPPARYWRFGLRHGLSSP